MLPNQNEPIVSIATAPGRGAVGIVRVSGKKLDPLIQVLCKQKLKPREATYLAIRSADGSPIDHGLAIHFPEPNSYTGEDVLELQVHGGPIVMQLLVARCLEAAKTASGESKEASQLGNIRLARAGEFTERAFLNGKIDLAQAEAIADLIEAGTEAAARSASRSIAGEFSNEIHRLRDGLIHLRMLVEATLDFPEEDIDFLKKSDAEGELKTLSEKLRGVLQHARQGALLSEGIKVVIAGQPNAGKSSLLNALAGAELAIVTAIPGTTRDKVQQTIQIEGVPLHVIDTAGLRESKDEVEQIGIARAWDEIKGADVVLFLHDMTRAAQARYQQEDAEIAKRLKEEIACSLPVIDVWNKCDVAVNEAEQGLTVSAKTGVGLDELRRKLLETAGWQPAAEGTYIARERHVQALNKVAAHLGVAHEHLREATPQLDLLAEELRLAQNELGEITGQFTSDEMLGVIFSKFCIGK